jgi:hypothetical protein
MAALKSLALMENGLTGGVKTGASWARDHQLLHDAAGILCAMHGL